MIGAELSVLVPRGEFREQSVLIDAAPSLEDLVSESVVIAAPSSIE